MRHWSSRANYSGALPWLREIWLERGGTEYSIGTVVNRRIARGGQARAVAYVDVGTLHGYREAITLLADHAYPADRRRLGS